MWRRFWQRVGLAGTWACRLDASLSFVSAKVTLGIVHLKQVELLIQCLALPRD